MSATRFGVIVAACAALVMFTARTGKAQPNDPKERPAVAEKWADDPGPPDRDDRVGPPGGPREGPPDDGDRNGPPADGRRRMGPRGEPRQGPPGDDDRGGPRPGGPGMGPGQGRPGMGPGGPGMGPGGPGMAPGGPSGAPAGGPMGGPMGGPGMGPGMGGPGMAGPAGRGELQFLEQHDPEMYKLVKADMDLERQTGQLAMQYRQAPTDQRAKLKEKLKNLVGKHFDVRQERRVLELKRLEAELQRLRESMDRRLKAREKLVEERVADLVGREEETGF